MGSCSLTPLFTTFCVWPTLSLSLFLSPAPFPFCYSIILYFHRTLTMSQIFIAVRVYSIILGSLSLHCLSCSWSIDLPASLALESDCSRIRWHMDDGREQHPQSSARLDVRTLDPFKLHPCLFARECVCVYVSPMRHSRSHMFTTWAFTTIIGIASQNMCVSSSNASEDLPAKWKRVRIKPPYQLDGSVQVIRPSLLLVPFILCCICFASQYACARTDLKAMTTRPIESISDWSYL